MLAASGHGGGNVLAALGLVAYTEALGRIKIKNGLGPAGGATPMERQFNAIFDFMGTGYAPWRRRFYAREHRTVYSAFRHGLAHEYAPKVRTKVVMFGAPRVAIVRRNRTYVFVVEAYLRDLMAAAENLEHDLLALRSPVIPTPD